MDLGLFLLHAVVGVFFIGHGAQKLFGAFGGHGIEGTGGFMESLGLKPGKLHATAAGIGEFGGGILLTLGLLVPLGAAMIVATMVAAIVTVHLGKGPFNENGGWELNVMFAVVAIALAGVGAGAWSLDAAFGLNLAGAGWAIGAAAAGLAGGIGAVLSGRAVSRSEDAHRGQPSAA